MVPGAWASSGVSWVSVVVAAASSGNKITQTSHISICPLARQSNSTPHLPHMSDHEIDSQSMSMAAMLLVVTAIAQQPDVDALMLIDVLARMSLREPAG